MKKYGLLHDCGYDSQVIWFDSIKDAIAEFESYGFNFSDLKENKHYSIVKKIKMSEMEFVKNMWA